MRRLCTLLLVLFFSWCLQAPLQIQAQPPGSPPVSPASTSPSPAQSPAAQPPVNTTASNETTSNNTSPDTAGDPRIPVNLVQVVNTNPIYDTYGDYGLVYDNSYYDNTYYHSGISNTAAAWIIGSIFIAIAVALLAWGGWTGYKRYRLRRTPRNYQSADF